MQTDFHNNKHHMRQHVIPEYDGQLDVGLPGIRFGTGRFRNLVADTADFLTATIGVLTSVTSLVVTTITATTANITNAVISTGLTLTAITSGYLKVDGSGVVSSQATPIPHADLGSSGSATTVLHGNETFAAVSLTADVSGVLPVANGGTNAATAAAARTSLGVAPLDPTFVTLSTNSELSNERVLTAGTGIAFTDGGAGSTLTVAVAGGSLANPIATQVFGG